MKAEKALVDILIRGGIIYTMDESRRIIRDGAVAVDGSRIIDVGPTQELDERHLARKVIDASGRAVLPGFVDVHTHLPSIFVRGVYGVVSQGLYRVLFPIKEFIEPKHIYLFGLAACIEALNSGITTIQESYNYMDSFAQAVEQTGIRANIGEQIAEADYTKVKDGEYTYLQEQGDEMYRRAVRLVETWHGKAEGRITTCFAPLAPDMCTARIYEQVHGDAATRGLKVTTHLAQSPREVAQVKRLYGKTPVEHLHDLGVLGESLLAAHCIHISDHDLRLLRETSTHVLHCPRPYLIGGATALLTRWLEEGVSVGLGTDNVYHSMWETMRAALYAARVRAETGGDGVRPSFNDLLELATIRGAEVLGMEDEVGSIELGKRADLQLINLIDPHLTPTVDLTSSLVLYGSTASVETVMVDGRVVKEAGEITTVDAGLCLANAQELCDEVWAEFFRAKPELRKLIG